MTVRELKRKLEDQPEDALVVVNSPGHSYSRAYIEGCPAEQSRSGDLFQYFGMCNLPYGSEVVNVVVFF